MKRLFAKPKSTLPAQPTSPPVVQPNGLPPSYTLPSVPHPCPYNHLALLVTPDGLLVRPHAANLPHPTHHVRIAWGKPAKAEEVEGDGEGEGRDWTDAVIVYGIVGMVDLYNASYVLAISTKTIAGNLLDEDHAVYGVKGITAIPLTEDRATTVLNTLASKNAAQTRPSLLPVNTVDTITTIPGDIPIAPDDTTPTDSDPSSSTATRVTFADQEDIKVISPNHTTEFSRDSTNDPPASSGTSTPSVETAAPNTTASVAKTLANRLSFWKGLSKRPPQPSDILETENAAVTGDQPRSASPSPLKADAKEVVDASADDKVETPHEVLGEILDARVPEPQTQAERHTELEDKIVKEIIREFTKGGMYFAYTFDITRSLQHKQDEIAKARKEHGLLADLNALETPTPTPSNSQASVTSDAPTEHAVHPDLEKVEVFAEPHPTLPLWRRVDRQFWWNEWMSKPLTDAGLHSYVLPIMQGYYQTASFPIAREPEDTEEGDVAIVDYILISRRSRNRAGLRYQRRGIDDEAYVANFVETEAIMRVDREGVTNINSHVQLRGSIPLFWSQPGYSLKPAPVLAADRTRAQNLDALHRHFQKIVGLYGPASIVNLSEQHGKEGAVTVGYREYVSELGWDDVQYTEYDFHAETKGMKYEKISMLIDKMERTFEQQAYLWISNGLKMSDQKGTFRVNCIDCLDRTNVVQSAFARHVLNRQLTAVALLPPTEAGRTQMDLVFNDIWANNGDAISRAYAGTSALKGDFTRYGKRDFGGMLNDGLNSLARMYTSTFSDWFCQAVIDFMLGSRTLSVFSEFLLKLQSSDPRDMIHVTKIRAEAIATSISRVLPEGERLLSGWTVFSPEALDAKAADRFEEKVLLLTVKAMYIISYDYTLEKVKAFHRVPLGDIQNIIKGAYIISPLEEASRDPLQNAGFLITWHNRNAETRASTYTVRNSIERTPSAPSSPTKASFASKASPSLPSVPQGKPTPMRRASALANKIIPVVKAPPPPPEPPSETTFAAFKALPIDPTRRQRSTGTYSEESGDLADVANSKEAVDVMVDAIMKACADIGNETPDFIKEEDVVSLTEAQRMTSVYAKMEYGVKRLLWLGSG